VVDGSGAVLGVMALDIAGGRITAVRSVVNPDKLAHLGEVGDMRALLDRRVD
jgi:RNA polymerase sigma-70 factor (ECF subfamily)